MSTSRESFSLLDEGWIPVRDRQNDIVEVSLTEALVRAHEWQAVVGDLPTQVFAMHRLLLAVVHRSVLADEVPVRRRWAGLWAAGRFPAEEVTGYLEAYRPRFDLLDQEAPFYQVPDLRTANNEVKGLALLVADVPSGEQFLTTRAGRGLDALSFAEATRWIINTQAFDPSGIKSGAVGDDRVKGGRGYPIGIAWAGWLGGILVEGGNLFETLMLNLVPQDEDDRDRDSALWERPPLSSAVEHRPGAPFGASDLLTWPSRRIRLAHDGQQVTGVLICNGDPLAPHTQSRRETMTAWRRSPAQEKKLGEPVVYMPKGHLPERSLWRGLEALLPQHLAQEGRDAPAFRPPQVLEWLARLQEEGVLEADFVLRTRAVGVTYGSNSSVIAEITADAMLIRAGLLTDARLRTMVVDAVSCAEAAALAIRHLAENLTVAAGGSPGGARDLAVEQAYHRLDSPFRRWLAGVSPASDPQTAEVWQRAVRGLLGRLANDLIAGAGVPAWIGREKDSHQVDSAVAEQRFWREIAKCLPLETPQPSTTSEDAVPTASDHHRPKGAHDGVTG